MFFLYIFFLTVISPLCSNLKVGFYNCGFICCAKLFSTELGLMSSVMNLFISPLTFITSIMVDQNWCLVKWLELNMLILSCSVGWWFIGSELAQTNNTFRCFFLSPVERSFVPQGQWRRWTDQRSRAGRSRLCVEKGRGPAKNYRHHTPRYGKRKNQYYTL